METVHPRQISCQLCCDDPWSTANLYPAVVHLRPDRVACHIQIAMDGYNVLHNRQSELPAIHRGRGAGDFGGTEVSWTAIYYGHRKQLS